MNTGSAFYIGKSHKICEDFACHGMVPEPYILLSDGCSGSPKTDFGSRILTQVASNLIDQNQDFDLDEILIKADETRMILNLPEESLDATLLSTYVKGEQYHLLMCGDGVCVKTRYDGIMEVILIEYPSNAPLYPNYNLNQARKERYITAFSLKRKIVTWQLRSGIIENLTENEDQSGSFYQEDGFCKNYKSISLMSDGVGSFYELLNTGTSKNENQILLNEVLKKLIDFKGFQDEFVDNRLQKFRKDCKKINWFHDDDVSLATIYFGE